MPGLVIFGGKLPAKKIILDLVIILDIFCKYVSLMSVLRSLVMRERHHGLKSWSERLQLMQPTKTKEGINWDTSHAANAPATTMR